MTQTQGEALTHEKLSVGRWLPGRAPVAVVLISLNEAHNMRAVLENIAGWAQEVFLVDSCSQDQTVDIALEFGIHIVQRRFRGFGNQWNFAINKLPITAPWTMKLDPDERLTDELKDSIEQLINDNHADGIVLDRRLWFMGCILPVCQPILRLWKSGAGRFTNVAVNEHPIVDGVIVHAQGFMEHHDSPDLDHWLVKQNRYTTSEAINQAQGGRLAARPCLLGSSLERRMWFKRNFWKIPGRYFLLFLYHYLVLGAWQAGKVGWIWSHMRVEVYRIWEYKRYEISRLGRYPVKIPSEAGAADGRVMFVDD
jgi:glycosyltransferase involved in cell wall biosynthesis